MDRAVSTPPEGGAQTPHLLVNPESLAPPAGFAHAVVPAPGRTVYLGGQAGITADGGLAGPGLLEQFDQALSNLVEALGAAGGRPEHLVQVHLFVTDVAGYRERLTDLGRSWREHLGRHYPAVALFEVTGLYDPGAVVELTAVAVVPEP
ncbi:MAG TPA: RidA family protein [Actinomycetota bacterium]